MMYRLWRYDAMLRIMVLRLRRNDAMFAIKQRSHIISEGNIIGETNIICRKANIIQKSLICPKDKSGFFVGGR